jgi:hypothetical protein
LVSPSSGHAGPRPEHPSLDRHPHSSFYRQELGIDPAVLKHGLEGDEEAEDNSEENQEDTGPSISTTRHGHPHRGI